jgi:hypothetical protein
MLSSPAVKLGADPAASVRYSPAKITGVVKEVIRGNASQSPMAERSAVSRFA